MEAVETQNINALYASIASDPYILDKADGIPFANTPLHEAASTGQARLAIEIRNLKPSLGVKLNQDGLSPLHLAVLNGLLETVRGLIKSDKDLIRVKGREMLTPLHYAIQTDDRVDILAEFLLACPESIEDLNAHGETALHIAVKKCNVKALEVLMGWIRKIDKHRVTYIQDGRGNTILHTAVSTSQAHIVESVVRGCKKGYPLSFFWIKYPLRLFTNYRNLEGATAADVAARLAPGPATSTIKSILCRVGASESSSLASDDSNIVDFFISPETRLENTLRYIYFWREAMRNTFSMEMRNTVLVVAALITAATFQVISNPSGGGGSGDLRYNSNLFGNESYINPTPSTFLLPTTNITQINATIFTSAESVPTGPRILLSSFYAFNTLAFIGSIAMIIVVLPFRVFALLHGSLCFMTLSYAISLQIIFPKDKYFGYAFEYLVIGICYLLFIPYAVLPHIEYVLDRGLNIFCVSPLQRKRLQMLHRVVKN